MPAGGSGLRGVSLDRSWELLMKISAYITAEPKAANYITAEMQSAQYRQDRLQAANYITAETGCRRAQQASLRTRAA